MFIPGYECNSQVAPGDFDRLISGYRPIQTVLGGDPYCCLSSKKHKKRTEIFGGTGGISGSPELYKTLPAPYRVHRYQLSPLGHKQKGILAFKIMLKQSKRFHPARRVSSRRVYQGGGGRGGGVRNSVRSYVLI